MLKSVIGVVAGYLVFAVSTFTLFRVSGKDPHKEQDPAFIILSVLSGMAFAFVGGYLSGVIAGRKPRTHGGAVALVLALGATASILGQPGGGSRWSQVAALAFMAPSAFAGGVVRGKGRAL